MKITASDLRAVSHTALTIPDGRPGWGARGVSTDSRTVERGDLFVALRGERFDGHRFLANAAARGAAGAVIDVHHTGAVPDGLAILVVPDTGRALLDLAARYRRKFSLPVVAIGGSNGKTTTKEMISRILAKRFRVLSTPGNLNNQIGVPQTIFRLTAGHDVAVVEVGTNHPGEIAVLRDVLRPTHALITNIGREHLEFFGTIDGVAREETALWEPVEGMTPVALVNLDDPYLVRAVGRRRRTVTFGLRARNADVRGTGVRLNADGTVRFRLGGKKMRAPKQVVVRLPALHGAANAVAAAAVGLHFRVPGRAVCEALQEFRPVDKRMEVLIIGGCTMLNDTYNANADSMIAALETLAGLPASGKRIAVLGDMLELGGQSAAEHERVGRAAAALGIDYVLTYGPLARTIAATPGLRAAMQYDQKNMLAEYLLELVAPGDVVLVKGSRGMRMEDIVVFLQERLTAPAAAG